MITLIKNIQLQSRIRLCFALLVSLFAIPLWVFTKGGFETYHIAVPLVIVMQLYLIQRFKNTQLLLILTLYAFIYFIYLIPYFYLDIQLSEHTMFNKFELFSEVLLQFYLFYAGLTLSATKSFNPEHLKLKDLIHIPQCTYKNIIFVFLLVIAFLLVLRQGENVFNSSNPYQAYMDNLESSSALPMFLLLLLFFSYFMIQNKKMRNVIFFTIFGGIFLFTITRGYRVLIAPLGFIFILLYFDLKIKTKWILGIVVLGFVGLTALNALKSGEEVKIEHLFSENSEYILSHHADNLYGSAAGVGLIRSGQIDLADRALLNGGFFLETAIPPAFLPNQIKYPLIISSKTKTGGGGLCITGAYMMWGYLGVFLFAFILGEFIRITYLKKRTSWALIAAIVLIYSANWFSYDFHVILRFPFFGFIIYLLIKYIVIKFPKYENPSCQ